MQWKGPYKVLERIGMNDYRVRVKGKVRTYHVNLLKEYVERKEEETKGRPVMEVGGSGVIESEEGEEAADEDQLLDVGQVGSAETYRDVKTTHDSLSKKQKSEVCKLLYQYRDVFTEKPGTTSLVEHPDRNVGR